MISSPPPAPEARASLHDETPVETAIRLAREVRELLRASLTTLGAHDSRITALEQLVGRLPSALPGDRGSGLAQHFVDLGGKVDALTQRLGDTIAALDADRAARAAEETRRAGELEKRRAPWSRAGWAAAITAISAVVGAAAGGAFHWFSTLHH